MSASPRIKLLSVATLLLATAFQVDASGPTGPIQAQDRTLYVITAGVTRYKDPRNDNAVRFASKDARDIGTLLRGQKGKLYGRVMHLHLEDENATRVNVLNAIDSLQGKVRPWDSVVVFLAGHGNLDAQNRYYFLPHEYDGSPTQTGLYGTDVRKALENLACVRMLILDTCRSAQAAHENRDTSIITLAACLPTEGSLELPGLQNGVFTRAFVDALMGAADINKDGTVTLAEMDAYICNRVATLVPDQHPNVVRPATVSGSFPLSLVADGGVGSLLQPVVNKSNAASGHVGS